MVPEDADGLGALLRLQQPELHRDRLVQGSGQKLLIVMDADTHHGRVDDRPFGDSDEEQAGVWSLGQSRVYPQPLASLYASWLGRQPAPPGPPCPLSGSPQAALVRVIVMGQQPGQSAVDDDTGHGLTLVQLWVPPLTPGQLLRLLGLSGARRPDHSGCFWDWDTVHSAGPCTDAPAWPLAHPVAPH